MSAPTETHSFEVARGDRFEFGKNWARFLAVLDDQRIALAERSLKDMLGQDRLDGLNLIDVGSGTGLFSLCARRLGAEVFSFDYDPQSVACTRELKRRYFEGDGSWTVDQGSVLDKAYLARLGTMIAANMQASAKKCRLTWYFTSVREACNQRLIEVFSSIQDGLGARSRSFLGRHCITRVGS